MALNPATIDALSSQIESIDGQVESIGVQILEYEEALRAMRERHTALMTRRYEISQDLIKE